ncbi:hypothetical protein CR513_00334, partial [Mucuna pruriens]
MRLGARVPYRNIQGVINTIVSGFGGVRSMSFTKRQHLRVTQSVNVVANKSVRTLPSITFINTNFMGVDLNKDDP